MEPPTGKTAVPSFTWPVLPMMALVILRTAIGWHLLYEGLVKLSDPRWTSAAYLMRSQWVLSDLFHWIAGNPSALRAVDLLNMCGLTLVGLGLMLGYCTRWASFFGALLLGLYYAASPPFMTWASGGSIEGTYLYVDKNLIELIALLLLTATPTGRFLGIDGMIEALRKRAPARTPQSAAVAAQSRTALPRRQWLQHLATLPPFAGFVYAYQKRRGWEGFEVKHLLEWTRQPDVDVMSGATMKSLRYAQLSELKGTVPSARIGNLELSRMFLGGNLIGGWAHARDLIYVSDLVQAYHTDEKVFHTFHLAERCGINTLLSNPRQGRVVNDYWKKEGGKIQFISDCAYDGPIVGAKMSIDAGAHACYVQGGMADQLVADGDLDTIAKTLDLIRASKLPAGIGAHDLATVQACVAHGLKPDFWVKTLHRTDYWSATREPQNDNIWCVNPQETIAFMEQIEQPWIAFKTLAAGAIHPKDGFPYAFNNGADFICVGMYDFQMVDNVNLVLNVLKDLPGRKRPWRA